ncbi:DUF4260 domain-containing protein [soil metagenome]
MKDTQTARWKKLEGALILAGSMWWYHLNSGNWWLFALFLFSFDVFSLGYYINKRVGIFLDNLGHTLVAPLIIMLFATPGYHHHLFNFALIWTSHIGLDRSFGLGLESGSKFLRMILRRVRK